MNSTIPVKPFLDQGHYTEFHNLVLDYIMPRVSGNAWKVLSLIIRKTKGWGKRSDEISYTQIKAGTGIKSDPTVSAALKQLMKLGCIKKRVGANQFDPTKYALNREFEIGKQGRPAIDFVAEEAATESTVAATKSIAATATEIKAVPTIETKDTKATKQNESNNYLEGGCEGALPHDSPAPENASANGVLDPPPEQSADTMTLTRICHVNAAHPDPRDRASWRAAVETVRGALPEASPDERAAAILEFERRWKEGGRRGSPYLSNVTNHFLRVMSDNESELSHGKNQSQSIEKRSQSAAERSADVWGSAVSRVME